MGVWGSCIGPVLWLNQGSGTEYRVNLRPIIVLCSNTFCDSYGECLDSGCLYYRWIIHHTVVPWKIPLPLNALTLL